jgi:hypothetical protein
MAMKSQLAWDFPNLKSAVLTGMPWDRKYLRPFRTALLSSSDLRVSFLPISRSCVYMA